MDRYNEMETFLNICEEELSACLKENSMPNIDLIEAIAVAKVKAVEESIEMTFRLKQEVGSYALMEGSGFEQMDFLQCCKFAEGDSRILMLKMARDRLSKYQRKMKKGDDSSSSGTTDDLEDEQCRIIMDTMKAADGAANNVGTYKEMNKLAEMTMERILTQYSGK